jgi:hypothetical protein
MTRRNRTFIGKRRLALAFAALIIAAATPTLSARADHDDHDGRGERHHDHGRHNGWGGYGGYYYGPGYYAAPGVVYAPPVYVAPPPVVVYPAPVAPSLNFVFPLRFH